MRALRLTSFALATLLPTTTPWAAVAQEPVRADSAAVDSLRMEIVRMQARIDSLVGAIGALEGATDTVPEDPIAALRAAAAEAARAEGATAEAPEEAPEPVFVGRQRSLQALNPEISVTGDILAAIAEGDPNQNNFSPRAFEFAFQSALDPYSRAGIFVGHHRHGPGAFDPFGAEEEADDEHGAGGVTEVEEGYVQWVNLPGGLGFTLGKFRQRLGTYNRWHAHALPGQSYFLPYTVFFGEEGLAQAGASVHWLAPFSGAVAYEAWVEVAQSDNPFFGDSRRLSYLAHLNAFWQLSPATYVELGVSGLTGTREDETGATAGNRLLHLEGAVNWRPPERALYRELNVRAAIMLNDRDPTVGGSTTSNALGAFALAELRLGRQWWVGGRFDYAENPLDPAQDSWLVAPTLSWWQSEWVRLRAEYDLRDGPTGRRGLFLIQTTFAMGPHKHENY
jgi:hypothetical protein